MTRRDTGQAMSSKNILQDKHNIFTRKPDQYLCMSSTKHNVILSFLLAESFNYKIMTKSLLVL